MSPSTAADLTELKVGISDPVNTVLAMWMAEAGGFYADKGLKVEFISMNGGSRGAAEVEAGNLQVMHVGLSSVVKINRSGGDLRLIGSLSNVIRFTFFSAPGVKTAADLKGGVVAVSSFGSESDATVTMALKKLGLTRQDVVPKEFGGGRLRIEALKTGAAKATSVNEPTASLAREQNMNVMVDLVPDHIPWLFSGIVVSRSYLESHRELLTRFLQATIEGNYLALTDEKRAKEVLARELKLTDQKIIDISYNDFKLQTPPDTEPTREGSENIIAEFPADGSKNVDVYVDTSLLEGLKKDGFFATMQRKYGHH